ncbi:MAG: sugar phosphate isomerase/epimerase family protein [Pseudomonadota bacterium]
MTLPVIGAALDAADLPAHRDWLFERDRDLELQDFFLPPALDDWRDLVATARRHLDGWRGRLGIHGPFFDLHIDALDPEARAFARRRLTQALDAAEALGADQMVVHSPFTTWGHNNDFLAEGGRQAVIDRTLETLRPIVDRAEGMGLTLVVENIEDKDPEARIALAEAFDSPAVAVSLDTGHAHYAHVSTGGRPVDWHVIAAGDRLAHVHVQDADGHSDRHWAPGRGSVPWRPIFEALAAHAPQARLVLELRDNDHVPEGADWLIREGLVQ